MVLPIIKKLKDVTLTGILFNNEVSTLLTLNTSKLKLDMTYYFLKYISKKQEESYLYSFSSLELPIPGNLIIGVKQNIAPMTNNFFNTLKEAFVSFQDYNLNLFQRVLKHDTYLFLKNELGDDFYKLEPIIAVWALDPTAENADIYFLAHEDVL